MISIPFLTKTSVPFHTHALVHYQDATSTNLSGNAAFSQYVNKVQLLQDVLIIFFSHSGL